MRLFCFIPLLFLLTTVTAQQKAEFPHKVGIKTNINISTLIGSELQNPRPKFGYTAGPPGFDPGTSELTALRSTN